MSSPPPAWLPLPCSGEGGLPSCEEWSLVTAPDEQWRCCVVERDQRCEHVTTYRVASADGALDDYTHVCKCHLELVRRAGDVVTVVAP